MYADRYTKPAGLRPGSLGLALGFNTVILGALFFAAPNIVPDIETTFTATQIPIAPPPPMPPPEMKKPVVRTPIVQPHVLPRPADPDPLATLDTSTKLITDSGPVISGGSLEGGGVGGVKVDPIKPPSIMIDPQIDSRFVGAFQPTYPADERRAGNDGRVTVRVLIGVDGRVKQVEKLAASSDSFFEVTRRRALDKWRFKPGTKDGVPVEAWRTMSVTFVLNDA
jgi:periplasmic protein TonB